MNYRVMTTNTMIYGLVASVINEAEKYNAILFKMLGEFCDKEPEQIKLDAERDLWMNSEESLNYGIVDDILFSKK